MRIMTGRARGLLIDNVESVANLLPSLCHGTKAFIVQDAVAAMAFVTKCIGSIALGREIRGLHLALEQG